MNQSLLKRPWHFLVLALVAVAPLAWLPWTSEYWIGMDDPNHLAIVHILQSLAKQGSPYESYLVSTFGLRSYMLLYWLLFGLMRIVSPLVAHKILISAVMVTEVCVAWFVAKRLYPARAQLVVLVAPLAMAQLLLVGFLSYMIAALFIPAALAVAYTRTADGSSLELRYPGNILASSFLLVVATLFHPFTLPLAAFCFLLMEGPRLRSYRAWLVLTALCIPAVIVLKLSIGSADSGTHLNWSAISNGAGFFSSATNLVLGGGNVPGSGEIPLWCFLRGASLIMLLAAAAHAVARRGVRAMQPEVMLNRLILGLFALFVLMPDALNGIGFCLTLRPLTVLILVIPAAASVPSLRSAPWIAFVLAMGLASGEALALFPSVRETSHHTSETLEASRNIPRGSKVLPLTFDSGGPIETPHRWGYVALERDIVTPYLFAARPGSFEAHPGDNVLGELRPAGPASFRPMTFRDPFARNTMLFLEEQRVGGWADPVGDEPYASERSKGMRDQILREVLDVSTTYDRILIFAPPDDFIEALQEHMTIDAHVGVAWVLIPNRMK